MNKVTCMPRLKGFRFPREIIAYAVWAYHRFNLSAADVKDWDCQVVLRWCDSAFMACLGSQFASVVGPEGEGIAASVAV